MSEIRLDYSAPRGSMKIMHAVNNAPAGSTVRRAMNNYEAFRVAGIPYMRNHDASFYSGYCGEHAVDVHRIFRNFDADECDPASYDFEMTDRYVKSVADVGGETFYRLGSAIEHDKKEGTFPPKDFGKWARICEHIIRHYNEGWADGYHYGLTYWEIWNEPDCRNADGSNPCWQGTDEQFVELYLTAHRHLKACFPHLKIGGPAFCSTWNDAYNKKLFSAMKAAGLKPDFFSFHGYRNNPRTFHDDGEKAYAVMKEYGWEADTELILNEWNYVRGWLGDDYVYSIRTIKGLKGSSFIAGTMAVGQDSRLTMMMYYDARPCGWNGMFDTTFLTPLKGYYPFYMYNQLYRMGTEVTAETDDDTLYVTAAKTADTAKGEGKAGFMATYYTDNDTAPAKEVTLSLSGLTAGDKCVSYYLLDEQNDMTLYRTERVTADNFTVTLNFGLYSTWFVKIEEQ